MFEMIWSFRFLPPGRGLWAMGTEAMWTHGAGVLNNCGFFSTQDLNRKPFSLLMHFSMLGVGCGLDTRGAGSRVVQRPAKGEIQYEIPDTREGWVDSTDLLLSSYLHGGPTPVFDYRKIRPRGALLKTFGGRASGPDPLIDLHSMLRGLWDENVSKLVDSTLLTDTANMMGVCVEMGNIRRVAEIVLGQYDDDAFVSLKDDYAKVAKYRYTSNNTVLCPIGIDYTKLGQHTAISGEPGYAWLENMKWFGRMNGVKDPADWNAMGCNPCVEQTLWDRELCNLVETFPGRHPNLHQYMRTLKMAYLYSKTVTLMKTGFEEVDSVIEKNRRIGCSQSGIIKAFNIHGRSTMRDWNNKCYDFITGLDADYSCWLGIPRSIKRTSIKPSGTVPLLPGETGALNYPISEFYYRTMRIDKDHPVLAKLEEAGYRIEENANGSGNKVVYFPVQDEKFTRGENDVSMWEQLENAAMYQETWADNQVSTTIKFDEKEAKHLPIALELYQHRLKAVAFLPKNQKFYPQAPYQPCTLDEYGQYKGSLKPVDYSGIVTEGQGTTGCDGDQCTL
jgi:adenosylcobalamin-dependent ribonucleoside-triphosphate reductase